MATAATRIIYRNRAKKKTHARAKPTLPLAVIAGFVPLALNVYNGAKTGGINGAGFELVRGTTGYNWQAGAWEWQALWRGMGPVVAGFAAHKVAGMLGINRALGRAKVPYLRF